VTLCTVYYRLVFSWVPLHYETFRQPRFDTYTD
jgi:hypothetical protein